MTDGERKLYQVHIETTAFWGGRAGTYLFTNKMAAERFLRAAERFIDDLDGPNVVEEITAYTHVRRAREQAWPFEELRP